MTNVLGGYTDSGKTLGRALIEAGFRDTLAYLEDVGTRMRMFLGVSGDLKGAIDKGSGTSAATGALQLLVQDGWSRNNEWGHAISGQVSIAAVDDTVRSLYASSLLAPRTGRLSSQLTGVVYRRIRWNYSVYVKGYSYLSTTTWSTPPSDSLDSPIASVTRDGNIVGGGLLFGGQVFKVQDPKKRNEAASIALEIGLAFRRLGGALIENDPAAAGQRSPDELVQPFFQSQFGFPTDDNVFVGLELGVLAFYKGFTLGVTFYHFDPDEQIQGFTGGQLAGGVSISLDLVEL